MRAQVRVRTAASAALVIASGELDLATVGRLRKSLSRAVEAGGPIIVDFTDVTFADSSAIGVVAGACARARTTEASIQLVVRPGTSVRKAFDLTGVTLAITVRDSIDEAIRGLGLESPARTDYDAPGRTA